MSQSPRLPTPPAGTVRALLQTEEIKRRFEQVLKERAPQFIASLAGLVYASEQLKKCDPHSVIVSALKAAALDLPIEPALGFAAIVPYGDKAQFQMQWKGYVQLALRTNQYANINVTEVYTGMVKGVDPFTGRVNKGEKTGDEIVGYYAYLQLVNGFEKEIYMTAAEVTAHGQKYSKTFDKNGSSWKTNPEAMGRKTVLKRLLTRYGILSAAMQKAVSSEALAEINGDAPAQITDGESVMLGVVTDPDMSQDEADAYILAKDKQALFGE